MRNLSVWKDSVTNRKLYSYFGFLVFSIEYSTVVFYLENGAPTDEQNHLTRRRITYKKLMQ